MKISEIIWLVVVTAVASYFAVATYGSYHRMRVLEGIVQANHQPVTEWTDVETGCLYLVAEAGGVTPKLGIDGFPLCRNSIDPAPASELPKCSQESGFPCSEFSKVSP